ncbi:hypothetical protein R2F61_08000 [Mollicutes bacterium LVI A0078]|nr:hypothetical protein RZE84_07775 [Mollicutes bacterium LVI A0075]WOO90657.1 hypothetical protein R2F61_08000 [Mollicutes bacterium LVI A0078]
MKRITLLIAIVLLLTTIIILNKKSSYEYLLIENGFVWNQSDMHEYDGYYLEMDTSNSDFCKERKNVSVYDWEPTSISYYCQETEEYDTVKEYEYDLDSEKLYYVRGASVYAKELELTNQEKKEYDTLFTVEFASINEELKGEYYQFWGND